MINNKILITELRIEETKEIPIAYYDNQLFNGLGYSNHLNDRLKFETFYKNGIKDGLSRYYENGQLFFESEFINGKEEGLKTWYENGLLQFALNYLNGKYHGSFHGMKMVKNNLKVFIKMVFHKMC